MHFSEPGPSKDFHKSWGKNDDGLLSDGKKMMTNDRVSWKMASHSGFTFTHEFAILTKYTKGQLISKCLLGVIVSTKKPTNFFLRISTLASKKRLNQ